MPLLPALAKAIWGQSFNRSTCSEEPPGCASGSAHVELPQQSTTKADGAVDCAPAQQQSRTTLKQINKHDLLLETNFESERTAFVAENGGTYGYGGALDGIRQLEFRRLEGQAYLDHAGAALYSEKQLMEATMELSSQLFSNPHSLSVPGSPSADALEQLRQKTLQLCNASGREYDVVITSGATSALKMVAECFPWSAGSCFAHPLAAHNSVLGMREVALAAGAHVQLVTLPSHGGRPSSCGSGAGAGSHGAAVAAVGEPITRRIGSPPKPPPSCAAAAAVDQDPHAQPPLSLLALPLECNFSGQRTPLDFLPHLRTHGVRGAHGAHVRPAPGSPPPPGAGDPPPPPRDGAPSQQRWLVLLDAAKACATHPPDLATHPVDFVALSYYKVFGHPTGLGALVVRRGALALMSRHARYFGGGTVEVAVADRDFYARRPGAAGLEGGTPAFTSAVAALHGFAFLERLGGLPAVRAHTGALARWLGHQLAGLRHANGRPACVLYGWDAEELSPPSPQPPPRSAAAAAATSAGGGGRERERGPTVAFNLLRPDGSCVGYGEVQRLAAIHGVHLRTGCFCNPGACAAFLGLSAEDAIRHFREGHVCWDDRDVIDGRPVGAVRVSLGHVSTFEDCCVLLQLLRRYFVVGEPLLQQRQQQQQQTQQQQQQQQHECAQPANVQQQQQEEECAQRINTPASPAAGRGALTSGGAPAASAPPLRCGSTPTAPEAPARAAAVPAPCAAGRSAAAAPPQLPLPPPLAGLPPCGSSDGSSSGGSGCLTQILLYPIKSCAPQRVQQWPVGPNGLLYDREWALVDDNGKVLTLKQCPRMATIQPMVDVRQATLTITAPAAPCPLVLALPGPGPEGGPEGGRHAQHAAPAMAKGEGVAERVGGGGGATGKGAPAGAGPGGAAGSSGSGGGSSGGGSGYSVKLDAGLSVERVQVCGDSVCGTVVGLIGNDQDGERVMRTWFARVLGAPCRIVQQQQGARSVKRPGGAPAPAGSASSSAGLETEPADGLGPAAPGVGFANDGQYLLVSEASLRDLRGRLESSGKDAQAADVARFRPNLVVSGFEPYLEDGWAAVQVGGLRCDVLGTCPRCELLQVDPRVGARTGPDVLVALAQYRRRGGRLHFGVLLAAAAAAATGPAAAAAAATADGSTQEVEGERADAEQVPVQVPAPGCSQGMVMLCVGDAVRALSVA